LIEGEINKREGILHVTLHGMTWHGIVGWHVLEKARFQVKKLKVKTTKDKRMGTVISFVGCESLHAHANASKKILEPKYQCIT